jgi:hypothetical protein
MDATTRQRSSATAEKISELFREVWPNRKRHPDLYACSYVATAMATVKWNGVKAPKSPPSFLGRATKLARDFLRELPAAREKLEPLDVRQISDFKSYPIEALPPEFREITEQIDRMAAVEREIQVLLNARFSSAGWNPGHFIGGAAQEAWRRTGEAPPGCTSEELCGFVKQALEAIGYHYSKDSVREMLRNRYKRRRRSKYKRRRSGKVRS